MRSSRNIQRQGYHNTDYSHGEAPYVPPARGGERAERVRITEWLKKRGLNAATAPSS